MRLLATMLLMLTVVACGGNEDYGPDESPKTEPDPIPNIATPPPQSAASCPTGTNLTYDNFGEGFMLSYCTMCHSANLPAEQRAGATVGVDFDTAAAVALWRAAILDRTTVVSAASMPPAGNVAEADKLLLQEWLSCGAPAGF